MCLTIPGKIQSIKEGVATVGNGSRTAQVDLGLVFDAKIGDWLLYATDRAVKLISERDAKEIIKLLDEKYRPVDNEKLPKKFVNLLSKISNSEFLISNERSLGSARDDSRSGDKYQMTKGDIEYLLSLDDPDCLETLYSEANVLRKSRIEDFVCIHGIIEFSNYCKNNCLYCGIRYGNSKLKRYRMTSAEIVAAAKKAVDDEGYKLIVLQSGEDDSYSDDYIIKIVKEIKKAVKAFVFISVGERSREFYKKAFKAGASGSLIRFETSNKELYKKLRPGHKLKDRISNIQDQINMGYYIASGSMVGLPGQTLGDIADDLLTIKKLGIPMISAGPYVEAKNTPLQITNSEFLISKQIPNTKSQIRSNEEQIELFLKYIAVARFMMPEIKIPVTTALETLDPENGRHRGLLAGANALMFNLTPEKFAGKYNIYDNKYREREKVWQKYGLFKGEESYDMLEKRLKVLL